MLITPEQIRAARALLRLDQVRLARDAGISVITVRRLEDPNGLSKVAPVTVDAVRQVLEKGGVEFIDRGVRRRAATHAEIRAAKDDIDRIVKRSAALMAAYPPMREEELYDETGI